jgi:hypothetical protein
MAYWTIKNTAGAHVDLATLNVYVSGAPGMGMPNIKHIVSKPARGRRAKFKGYQVEPRTLILNLTADGASWVALHQARQDLIDLIQPDRLADETTPLYVRYTGAGATTVELECYYESGLEKTIHKGFTESIALRLKAYQPFWKAPAATNTALNLPASTTFNYGARMDASTGVWSDFDSGAEIYCMAVDSAGMVYAGGAFVSIGGIAANRIAKYNPNTDTWSALGTGFNGSCFTLAIGPDDTVYAGGDFAQAGGIANTAYIARWTGAAWTSITAGGAASHEVHGLAFGPDGTLYATGNFTGIGGVAAVNYVAQYSGSAWTAMGTGMNAICESITVASNGTVYVSGSFTTAGGTSATRIAAWNGSSWSALGAGLGDIAYALRTGLDGRLYAGGAFLSAGGDASIDYLAAWNGSSWSALGSGVNGQVRALARDTAGNIYAGGNFTNAGGYATDGIALWTGSTWLPMDIDLPGTYIVYAIALSSANDIYVAFGTTAIAATFAGAVTTVNNTGTATVYPTLTITGALRLVRLVNFTTGEAIYFNYTNNAGETLTIDLSEDAKTVTSSWRGPLLDAVIPGSNLSTFRLMKGNNIIGIYIGSATSPAATLSFTPLHWSTDGVA